MKGGRRKALVTLSVTVGVILLIMCSLQIVLNSSIVSNYVDKLAAEKIDGSLNYGRIKVSLWNRFPKISVQIDSLSLTYPHERFSRFDTTGVESRLRSAGTGLCTDTLVRFDRLDLAVNAWQLIAGGRVRISRFGLSGLGLYAHSYDDSLANWQIFRASEKSETDIESSSEKDSTLSLPWISVGEFEITGRPHIVYTSLADTVMAAVSVGGFSIAGDLRLSDGSVTVRNADLALDSIFVAGRLPADTLAVGLDHLYARQNIVNVFDIDAAARALALTNAFGRLEIPLELRTRLDFGKNSERTRIKLSGLDAAIAYVPIRGDALAELYSDSTYVDADLHIDDCDAGTLLEKYARAFTPKAADIGTDARISISVDAEGYLSDGRIPEIGANLTIPSCRIYYKPYKLPAVLDMDIDAEISPEKSVYANVKKLFASAPGLELNLSGSGNDITGSDPGIDVRLGASAVLDSLMRFLPEDLLLSASGNLNLGIDARAQLSELRAVKFNDARLDGHVESDVLKLSMPADSLELELHSPAILFNSTPVSIAADMLADSLMARMGASLSARVRGMENHALISAVRQPDGRYAPRISLDNSEKSVFLRSDRMKAAAMGVKLSAALQKRLRPRPDARMAARRKRFLDSLRREHPGASRDELMGFAARGAGLPDFMASAGQDASDINVQVDSSIKRYLRQWSPEGSADIRACFVASPALPLRTSVSHFAAGFDSRSIHLDSLYLRCGTSDINARGSVRGLMPLLMGRGMVDIDVDINSRRINANELLAALEMGRGKTLEEPDTGSESLENNDSFVLDSLDVEGGSLPDKLIMLPGNVRGVVRLNADKVEYSDLVATPMQAQINLRDKCLQLCNTSLETNIGQIGLDAFYATRSRYDVGAGVNVTLREMSAEGIISMLPVVDSLMPALRSFKGKLNCDLSATTQIDTNMNVITPTLDAVLDISGHELRVDDAGPLRKVTGLLMFRNRDIGEIRDLSASCVIHDNRLEVFPFVLGVDRYTLALSGLQNFDQTMNYHVSILKSPFLVRFGINVYGTLDNWRFSLGKALYKDGVPVFSDQLDRMQSNILEYIRNIYSDPVNPFGRSVDAIGERKKEVGYVSDGRSAEFSESEAAEVDAMLFAACEDEFDAAVMNEVDAVLNEAHNDMEDVMREYESLMYDKRIQKRIEKLKKQSESRKG